LRSTEGAVLAHNNPGDFVEEGCAAAHVAGGEGRVEGSAAVVAGGEPAGVFQAVHLGVQHHAAALLAAVVSPSDDFAVDYQDRPDGDAPLGESLPGFL